MSEEKIDIPESQNVVKKTQGINNAKNLKWFLQKFVTVRKLSLAATVLAFVNVGLYILNIMVIWIMRDIPNQNFGSVLWLVGYTLQAMLTFGSLIAAGKDDTKDKRKSIPIYALALGTAIFSLVLNVIVFIYMIKDWVAIATCFGVWTGSVTYTGATVTASPFSAATVMCRNGATFTLNIFIFVSITSHLMFLSGIAITVLVFLVAFRYTDLIILKGRVELSLKKSLEMNDDNNETDGGMVSGHCLNSENVGHVQKHKKQIDEYAGRHGFHPRYLYEDDDYTAKKMGFPIEKKKYYDE